MATTLNKSYMWQPTSVSQGGSGIASNTAYSLLAGGVTSTSALQQAGTGTSGQLYLSGGASALGTWTNNATATAMQKISSQTASNSATIDFTGLTSSYFAYKIIISAVVPVSSAVLLMRFSNDNGSTFFAGATDYGYAIETLNTSGTLTAINSTGATSINLTGTLGNTASQSNNFDITILNPVNSIQYNGGYWTASSVTGSVISIWGAGATTQTISVNAIRFLMSTGNISSGVFTLYGLLA